jgi:hypothetical protein
MISALLRRALAARQEHRPRLPRLRVGPGAGAPRVFYLCPDNDVPSGGVRAIYRHVDMLNAAGIDAAVLHHDPRSHCTWFENQTRVAGAATVTLTPRDVLVVSEWYGPDLYQLPAGPRLVVFNQNAYQTFLGIPYVKGDPYRRLPGLEAILTVSENNADYLRFAFPGLQIVRVRCAVDGTLFRPPDVPPGRRVGVMPRKRPDDCNQLMHLLRARGCLDGWEAVTIDGLDEAATAQAMRSCSVFLSLSKQEGFGLPPAEAMACGCYVVGFTGLGGREFFDPAFSSPVEDGDVLGFARAAEAALAMEPAELAARAKPASEHVLDVYAVERQHADLLGFFDELLKEG